MPAPSRPMIGARSLMDAKAYRERAGRGVALRRGELSAHAGRRRGHEDLARSRVAQVGIGIVASLAAAGCGQGVTGASHASGTAPSGTPVLSLLGTGAGPGAGGRRHARDARSGPTDPGRHGRRRDHRGAVRPTAGILRALPPRRGPDLALDHGGGERQPVVRHASIPARSGRASLAGIGLRQRVPDEPARWRAPRPRNVGGALGRRPCAAVLERDRAGGTLRPAPPSRTRPFGRRSPVRRRVRDFGWSRSP